MTATTLTTSLFKPAEVTSAYLKMALMGFQGSGKTYTAADIAIGLVKLLRESKLPAADKPVAFLDTEKGSDWVKPFFDRAGIDLVGAKTRAFTDLLAAVPEAEAQASVLLIDSLTHFWVELCDTYCATKAREYKRSSYRLQFQDWSFLKAEWRKFTDRFVNSRIHIIVCGRAGYEYDFLEDEDTKKKQLEKTGIKMKAEGEMGYEPDLLVLMERRMNMDTKTDEHMAHVVKDRSTLLDGKEFSDPTFKDFLPHVRCLNLGGRQMAIDTTRTSAASIPAGEPRDRGALHRAIIIDEINDLLMHHGAGGTSEAAKKKRSELLKQHFGTVSKTQIEELMPIFDLRAGYDSLHIDLQNEPSRYHPAVLSAAAPARTIAEDLGDSLPDHSAPPPKTAKQRLLEAIPKISSHRDSLQWQLASFEDYDGLPSDDKADVAAALTAHNSTLKGSKSHLHVVS